MTVMEVTVRSNRSVTFQCAFHVVWCSKYRRRVLEGHIEARLEQIVHQVIEEKGAWLTELDVMPDCVHMLVGVDPQYGVHRLVKAIKARSSHILREEFPALRSRLPTLWTNAYFVATVGDAPPEAIRTYVENQKSV